MHDHDVITTEPGLRQFLHAIADNTWVAVDTEFMREKTYFPRLCLIQIATDQHIACIDALAFPDLTPLHDLLQNPRVTKVFHAAGQDLEVLYLVTGQVPAPVFDTQVAASLLGYGEQIGYGNLVQKVLNRDLEKTQSRTDWSRRPLQPAQLEYARDDVRYLAKLYKELREQLETHGRQDWLGPEMEALTRPELYRPEPSTSWRRVSGHRKLKPAELAALRELAAWRETEAQRLDRPRRWVISDDLLLTLARARPPDMESLRNLRGLPPGLDDERARGILHAVERGSVAPRDSWPTLAKPRPLSEAEEVVVDIAMALLRELSRLQQVSPQAVASRKDVVALLRGDDGASLAQGWRQHVAGAELQRWLAGKSTIRCSGRQVELDASGGPNGQSIQERPMS